MGDQVVASPVQRLRSMSRLMPVNVSRMRRPAQIPLGQLRPAPIPHQLLSPSLAVTLPLVAVVLVKQASLREDSLCARDLRLMMPLPQSRPPNLVRAHHAFFIYLYLPHLLVSAETSPGATDFYDNIMDSYSQPSPPPKLPSKNDRIANWARNNTGGPSLSRAPSAYGGSTRSGTLKRRVTRRTVAPSVYDEDEEGYVTGSGEWDELYELTKIRVKIHFDGDVRGMALDPGMPFTDFKQRVAAKFETSPQAILLKFRDEDGGKVSLRDESDYELAIETARESAKGRPEGRLEVWCETK
jgi:hypothetical protein